MKVHKSHKKVKLVLDPQELFQIAVCLSESPKLTNRKLAFKLRNAVDEMQKEGK